MTPRKRISLTLGAVSVVATAVWLLWLIGGGALENDMNARLDTLNDSVPDSAVSVGKWDPSSDTTPRPQLVPGTPTIDSLSDDPRVVQKSDPILVQGPIDTALGEVERALRSRAFVIPVKGIPGNQLLDTYTASRSEGRVHNAIDIMAPGGTPCVAVTESTVLKLFNSERGGITLYLLDPDGRTVYYYAHLQSYATGIVEGKRVKPGELIGFVGDTGNAGPGNTHLHFEITIVDNPKRFWTGTPVNPYPLLRGAR